ATHLAAQTLLDRASRTSTPLTGLPWNDHVSGQWEPEPIRWLGIRSMYRIFGIADDWERLTGAKTTSLLARFGSRLAGLHEQRKKDAMTGTPSRIAPMAATYPASSIRKMFNLALDFPDAVKLTVGEPDFTTPEHIKAAGIRGIENDNTRYVANAGTPELRQALAEKYSGRWGRSLGPENVMVSFGAMEALTFALDVTVSPGQEVIIPDPSFPNYLGQVHRLGGAAVSVPVREDNDFKLRAEDVRAAITDKTAAVIINSPSNPLGSVMDRTEIERLADLADEHGFTVISDEVYDEMVFDDAEFTSIAEV